MDTFSILSNERIASIRDIQKNPSQTLKGITRVTRGGNTIGFFLSNDEFAELVESHEALSSPAFVSRVAKSRRELKSGKGKALASVMKEYGL
ncbi:hypothetical protein KKF59_01900 [Patescibacteria group bacterium]|nr:hypothetical protein [Patescibacteria group bacterium]MBU1034514.1 hypothetical protein [Patescibacteria group bacterium]MBU1629504.1 hypothetical protein [Patescibacteria group bacterium]MBU1907864.1 hypothetical protein [Patescibacteria group bacterium]